MKDDSRDVLDGTFRFLWWMASNCVLRHNFMLPRGPTWSKLCLGPGAIKQAPMLAITEVTHRQRVPFETLKVSLTWMVRRT